MEKTIQIYIRNNGQIIEAPMGATLEEIYQLSDLKMKYALFRPTLIIRWKACTSVPISRRR